METDKHTQVRPLSTIIFSVTAVLITLLLIYTYNHRNRAHDLINVTGLAKRDFVSDLIVWKGRFSKKNTQLRVAYTQLKRDRERVRKYLVDKGIKPEELIFSAVDIDSEYETTYDKEGRSSRKFTGYRLSQNVQIESNDVNRVESISREITDLIDMGVEFRSRNPEYYYTQLSDLKIEMLAAATDNAKVRADNIAQNANGKLGKLKFAKMGVFQIIAQNSSESYSWGGAFNTSAKNKTAAITIKLQYELN